MRVAGSSLVAVAALCWFAAAPVGAAEALLSGPALGDALRAGGLVLYMRHGVTNAGETDFWQRGTAWDRATLADCAQQRNLSAAGREQMRRMGEAVARLKLPWGSVLTSPYCRTRETADLAFGRGEESWDLFYHLAARSRSAAEGEAVVQAVRRLLGTPPTPGENTVLVSHGGNLSTVAGIYLSEGESAVFQPAAGSGFTLVGRIGPDDWGSLARRAAYRTDTHKDTLQRRRLLRPRTESPSPYKVFHGRVYPQRQP